MEDGGGIVVCVCVCACLHECVYCVFVQVLTKRKLRQFSKTENMIGAPITGYKPTPSCTLVLQLC